MSADYTGMRFRRLVATGPKRPENHLTGMRVERLFSRSEERQRWLQEKCKDIIGTVHGRLEILDADTRGKVRALEIWVKCRCECGNEKWMRWNNVRSGSARNCGCEGKKKSYAARRALTRERDESIVSMAKSYANMTAKQIGDAHGVSASMVRYVLKRDAGEWYDKEKGRRKPATDEPTAAKHNRHDDGHGGQNENQSSD